MNEWEWQLLEEKTPVDHLEISGVEVRTGSRVRLRPRKGGDVMDIALAGQIATIEWIEQDYEGKVMCVWFSIRIRDGIWACCANQDIASFLMRKKSSHGPKKKPRRCLRPRSRASSSPGSVTFSWATMPLALR